jgi:ribose/xylose/arabinose/galactoside ABC-type transport system permease subunit
MTSSTSPGAAAATPGTPGTPEPGTTPQRSRGAFLAWAERYALLLLTVAIAVFFSVYPASRESFATMANVQVTLGTQTAVALLALAAVFPLVAGNIDFSVGATAASSMVLAAGLMSRDGLPLAPTVVICVLFGGLVGLVNGVAVTRFRMNPFVTTLGVATLLGGLIQWYTGGQAIFAGISTSLTRFGSLTLIGLPQVTFVVAALALVSWYVLTQTAYGRFLYAVGSNERSARLVGIAVGRNVLLSFVIAGLLAGVAGVLQLSRTGSATADSGTGLLFPALAAVFLGATAVRPGFFNVAGAMIGVLFVSVSVSGLTLSGASAWVSPVFNGVALLVAVGLSSYLGRRVTG